MLSTDEFLCFLVCVCDVFYAVCPTLHVYGTSATSIYVGMYLRTCIYTLHHVEWTCGGFTNTQPRTYVHSKHIDNNNNDTNMCNGHIQSTSDTAEAAAAQHHHNSTRAKLCFLFPHTWLCSGRHTTYMERYPLCCTCAPHTLPSSYTHLLIHPPISPLVSILTRAPSHQQAPHSQASWEKTHHQV